MLYAFWKCNDLCYINFEELMREDIASAKSNFDYLFNPLPGTFNFWEMNAPKSVKRDCFSFLVEQFLEALLANLFWRTCESRSCTASASRTRSRPGSRCSWLRRACRTYPRLQKELKTRREKLKRIFINLKNFWEFFENKKNRSKNADHLKLAQNFANDRILSYFILCLQNCVLRDEAILT